MKKVDRKNTPGPVKESAEQTVIAAISFFDALTGRQFDAGDVVLGWDEPRIEEYSKRGLIYRTSIIGPTEVK
jgi:hypothetical protein